MNDMLAWGLDVVRVFQRVESPVFTLVMKGISFLGSGGLYVAALLLIYWCIDRRLGARIGLLVLFSAFLNGWLKDLLGQPRPFQVDPRVGLDSETGHGLPSGHAQGSAVFWGSAAPLFKRPWGLVLALVLPLFVGLSRIYLGVHFPTDVLVGWAVGGLLAAGGLLFGDWVERMVSRVGILVQSALAGVIAIAMWVAWADAGRMPGLFFGFSVGLIAAANVARFSASGPLSRRALRYGAGIIGLAVVYLVPRLLLGDVSAVPVITFFRYVAVGLWGTLGAPWVFLRLRLADEATGP